MIKHQQSSILIKFQTDTPAVSHQLLLQGISDLMKYYASHPDKTIPTEGICVVLDFQRQLIPDEVQLSKAYG